VLDGRYRIVGLLGKGGMGEVYRADDLKLGQPVALKFLPRGFDAVPERLELFLNEVRTARQVSHTNVCRIYDAGEVNGQHFLSMEYVDGEDLASLLRRIGHIPKDKAIQIARQMCAGLAAAHEAGVLHRDLKPANVMIDGRGRARITDFGLAAVAEDLKGSEIQAGTPAYMAPEQLTGHAVSVRSDIYSLGLVLYELFTGKKAFPAHSSEPTPSAPSSFMEGFDPMVERVILRCLDPDPARRPSSALAVAAALPGGDPLAAALAAGETPSPEMVAEAGDRGAVSPVLAWSALGLFLGALAGFFALAPYTSLLGMVRLDKPPEFLQERAREILVQAGVDQKPADSLFTFDANRDFLEDLARRKELTTRRWDVLRAGPPSAVRFWYRQSQGELVPFHGAVTGRWMADPPTTGPGMAKVGLDDQGRLHELVVVPGERAESAAASPETDWGPLLRATGIEEKTLVTVAPEWAPPVFADRRAAWTASWPGKPDVVLRIEAAAAGGRPVSLRVIEPWDHPSEGPEPPGGFWARLSKVTEALVFFGVVLLASAVALRNVRRGRGDRRGALRLALYLGAARLLWFLGAHHVVSPEEQSILVAHLAYAMYRVGLAYVVYLAVEPYARRVWPQMLVSWVRVLEGRFRDPLVGRDLLIGCAAGTIGALSQRLPILVPQSLDGAAMLPAWSHWTFETLRGAMPAFVSIIGIHVQEMTGLFFPLTLLLIFRMLLRRTVPAFIGIVLVGLVLFLPESGSIPAYVASFVFFATVVYFVLFRAGLLAFATTTTVSSLVGELPLTPHPAGWYAGTTLFSLAVILALALYGFWISQAERPMFRDELLEPVARR
jgi:serine/threonine-protein kinase